MSAKVSPTLKVLLEIRDEVRRTNEEVRRTNERVDGLERALVAELGETRKAITDLSTFVRDRRARHERRIEDHERRLRALERKTG